MNVNVCVQDDSYLESYISTIGVDFVSNRIPCVFRSFVNAVVTFAVTMLYTTAKLRRVVARSSVSRILSMNAV
jgi:hypothetical protein